MSGSKHILLLQVGESISNQSTEKRWFSSVAILTAAAEDKNIWGEGGKLKNELIFIVQETKKFKTEIRELANLKTVFQHFGNMTFLYFFHRWL